MTVFKTFEQIKKDVWSNSVQDIINPLKFPKKNLLYTKKDFYDIQDIECWEEIYYEAGNIGLYAAWSPYVECYIIVYNLFMHRSFGIEIYGDSQSPDQIDKIITRMKKFNIDIPLEITRI